MAFSSRARALRRLVSLAQKLQGLADETPASDEDRDLFLTTATALEARANRVATTLPGQQDEPQTTVQLHKHVDLRI